MCCDLRIADLHGTGPAQKAFAPESHVLVRRPGVPINPIYTQVFLGLRDGFDGQHVRPVALEQRGNVELVGAIGSCDFTFPGELAAVDPDVRAIIDPTEIEPHALAIETVRRAKFGAVPPRAAKRA